jgi:hypothetical protein
MHPADGRPGGARRESSVAIGAKHPAARERSGARRRIEGEGRATHFRDADGAGMLPFFHDIVTVPTLLPPGNIYENDMLSCLFLQKKNDAITYRIPLI